jgi:hypothetical protein
LFIAVSYKIQGMDKNMETPREMHVWIEVFILATFVGDFVSAQYHYLYNLRNTLQASFVVETVYILIIHLIKQEHSYILKAWLRN